MSIDEYSRPSYEVARRENNAFAKTYAFSFNGKIARKRLRAFCIRLGRAILFGAGPVR